MKILHYSLGFPPYRTGGLTKYCVDLMLTQKEHGNEVALLWPGRMGFSDKKIRIHKSKNWQGIESFELVNPLPVALDEGILDCTAYMTSIDSKVYLVFLKKFKPEVIHIHTWMGLHREFLAAAKALGIRTVFTTHDYYGICPKVTLFHDGCVCDDDHGCTDCVKCNQSALSIKKIMLMQSPLYRALKNTAVVKKLRQKHRQEFFEEPAISKKDIVQCSSEDYQKLREYYVSMLEMVDFIHFNSTVSEMVYKRYFQPRNSAVISITHRDIQDHRKIKNFDHDILRITYLGPAKPFKGFQFLIAVLDKLWSQEPNTFELHIYSETKVERVYISHRQNGYSYRQLEEIFDNTDLLVVPSQWYETFGFTVLEALSYGVPVIVSDKVGAGDLIKSNAVGLVSSNEKMIKHIEMICANHEQLVKWNESIQLMKLYKIDCINRIYR